MTGPGRAGTTARLRFRRGRTPVILQTERSECGLACLAMVAGAFGHAVGLAELRARFEIGSRGTTFRDLMAVADALGLSARALRIEPEDLGRLRTPCILHWELDHFVVLRLCRRGRVTLHDPARGKRVLSLEQVRPSLAGPALELVPAPRFRPRRAAPALRISDLLRSARGIGRSLGQIFAVSFAMQAFALLAPYYTMLSLDRVLPSRDEDLLTALAAGFAALAVVEALTGALGRWMAVYLDAQLRLQLDGGLFRHLLRLPLGFFEMRHLGDVESRFDSLRPVQEVATTGLVEGILALLMTLGALALMLAFHPPLTLLAVAAVALASLVQILFWVPLRGAISEEIAMRAREKTAFLESVRAAQPIKLFNREAQRTGQWLDRIADALNVRVRVERLGLVAGGLRGLVFSAERILLVWAGVRGVLDATWTVGALIAFQAWRSRFSEQAQALIDLALRWRTSALHLERLADIAHAAPEEPPGAGEYRPGGRSGAARVTLDRVRYRYSALGSWVLEDLGLDVEPGECLAIAGPSGGGKTTLLKVALGLLHPQAGEVRCDGRPIRRMGLAAYRSQIGAVMQEDTLLSGSILDNVGFFDPRPDPGLARECLAAASVADEIDALPMGLRTRVGDLGSGLSGGQQQRLLLARALYARPRALFLDEATSHLDPRTEAAVHASLRQLRVTRILVAHRRETLALADRVLGLSGGRVVELAPPKEHRRA